VAAKALPDCDADTIVIGGGIIGVAIAAVLRDRSVVVLDSGEPRFGTSMANAGHIVVSHATPFAAPRMVRMGLKSLAARDGSFALSPKLPLSGLSWLGKFMSKCNETNSAALTPGLLSLLEVSAAQVRQLGIPTTPTRLWEIFTSRHSQEDALRQVEHMQQVGLPAHLIDRSEALDSEPLLTSQVQAVVELGEDFGINPEALWKTLRDANPDATYVNNVTVDSLAAFTDRVLVGVGNTTYSARTVVIAAGAWTPTVTKLVGVNLPIIAAKGYSITVANMRANISHPMILADEKTAVDPMGSELRMSARFELTRANDRSIATKRIHQMYERARHTLRLPEFPASIESLSPWTGVRPVSADGAPFIGPLASAPNVFVASGHGMIGTSMAMGTADLITRYLRGERISEAELALTPNR
jgi:D-amino-acid dehydrogenase